jgi:site-specific recombinase XerD
LVGIISKSPCIGVAVPKRSDILAKDILSQEEMRKLFATHYKGENPEIRRAFAMTCLSGIRLCDIIELTYDNVDYSNRILKFRQSKTKKHSNNSGVIIPINDTLMSIIGKKKEGSNDDYIFHLPSDTMCFKALRCWTKKAGIDKHITWHCGRHSFATSLLNNGVNIKVVSNLLGHSTIRFTEIYLRAVDKQKIDAINTLPNLNFE